MKKCYKQFGWTLIELLIVLACIAILTAILLTSLIQPAITKKDNQLLLNNVTALVDAAHNYRLAHNGYGKDSTGDGLLDANNGIVSYLTQNPSSTLWSVTTAGVITCPEGSSTSTCPQQISVSGDSDQQFTLTMGAVNGMANVQGLLQESGGDVSSESVSNSGFKVIYD